MNYNNIAQKIEDMIKEVIMRKGLIDTGRMYDSINVIPTGDDDYHINAVDYFKYVDGNNDITYEVFESKELYDFIQQEYIDEYNRILGS